MMKIIIKVFFILLSISPYAHGYEYEKELSKKLNSEYKKIISKTQSGKEFYKRYAIASSRYPKVLLRYSDDNWLGWYEPEKERIYLNTKYIMIFFGIKDYTDEKIIKVMALSEKVRKEFVRYSDSLFLHEMVHSLQYKAYKEARYKNENELFIEFEYEAYFISDMYFYEKMENNKKLFYDIISNKYNDLYTSYSMGGVLNLIYDIDEYRDNIKNRYIDEKSGYVSLSDEEEKKKAILEEKKILSYAAGDIKSLAINQKDYELIKKQEEDYRKFIDDFYKKYWSKTKKGFLKLIIETSYIARNYYLFFNSAYSIKKDNITDFDIEEKISVMEKDFKKEILSNHNRYTTEDTALMFKSFEKLLDLEKRNFPRELIEIRNNSYMDTTKKYSSLLSSEKSEIKKNEYRKDIEYFLLKITDGH